jgi:hypothetical protein
VDSVINRAVTVAAGRFAPGHLGELTQHLPFELVDEALAATGATQSRLRDLPSRVVVYLLLAACLFGEVGYPGVWRKLTAGLDGIGTAMPTASALAQARRRVGVAPLRWLFDLLRGPAATPRQRGTRWRGLLVCAIDGTTMTVPDTPAVLTRFTNQAGNHGGTGYPQLRLLALVACGTRTLIDVVFGPHYHRRNPLRSDAAAQPATRDDPAGRPQLRRHRPHRRHRGDRGRGAGAAEEWPHDAGAGPLLRWLLPVDAWQPARAGSRGRDHHQA